MEEQQEIEPDYLKGFNEGYTIAQYMPELAEQLAGVNGDSTRLVGFKDGQQQYQKEQLKELLPTWLKGHRSTKEQDGPSKSKNRDREPEK